MKKISHFNKISLKKIIFNFDSNKNMVSLLYAVIFVLTVQGQDQKIFSLFPIIYKFYKEKFYTGLLRTSQTLFIQNRTQRVENRQFFLTTQLFNFFIVKLSYIIFHMTSRITRHVISIQTKLIIRLLYQYNII